MKSMEKIFSGEVKAGVYKLSSDVDANTLLTEVRARGWIPFYFDGQAITDKESFLRMAAAVLEFPSYFGKNWDAFEECVTDLEWVEAQPCILIYDHVSTFSDQNSKAWGIASGILTDAAEQSKESKKPLYILLRHTADDGKNLPTI